MAEHLQHEVRVVSSNIKVDICDLIKDTQILQHWQVSSLSVLSSCRFRLQITCLK